MILDDWQLKSLFWGLWSGLLPATVLAPAVYWMLLRLRSRQTVSEFVPEHQGKQGTPTMGGIIVLLGLIGVYCWSDFSIPKSFPISVQFKPGGGPTLEGSFAPFLALLLGFAMIGFLDDFVVPRIWSGKRGLGWVPKLILQFGIAVPACLLAGTGSWLFPETGSSLQTFYEAFFIVAVSNAFNLSDGMDGLAGGLAVILALAIGAIGIATHAPCWHTALCFGVVGSMLPFLFLNAPPAKVFMGDVGSLPIGAVLGWLLLGSGGRPHVMSAEFPYVWLSAVALLSAVLMAELIPVPLQILWVKLFKRRLFPMTPIHHAFQKAGWPETRVVALFHLVQVVCAFLAVYLVLTYRNVAGY